MQTNANNTRQIQDIILIFFLFHSLILTSCEQQKMNETSEQTVTIQEYNGTIIAVGDSLTAGFGVMEHEAYPAQLAKKIQEQDYNWQVINSGINGETSSSALSRIKWIVAQHPDIVILETGANDGLRGIPTPVIKENINNTVQLLQKANIEVVLAGIQIVRNLGPLYEDDFTNIYPAVAKEHQTILIPFFLQGVAGIPALNQADSIHPNAEGHKIIAETVYPYVLQALAKKR